MGIRIPIIGMDAMISSQKKLHPLVRLMKNDRGNFGIITAIVLPVTLATAGVAMDLTRMLQVRTELQNAADSAVLAAASAMSEKGLTKDEALKLAREYLAAQMANLDNSSGSSPLPEGIENNLKESALATATETANGPTGKFYDIKLSATYNVAMNGLTSLLGVKSVPVSATSSAQSATESKNALSMYLVLDRSGSMAENTNESYASTCYYSWGGKTYSYGCTKYITKIEALKTAVKNMADVLTKADPTKMYARTAAVSYNGSMQTPTAFEWGTAAVVNYVNALPADGFTDSSDAMARAYAQVRAATETTAHKNKNGQAPSRYILFMTDGANNHGSADTKTKKTCEDAKKEGIEIYTVAFMAPKGGQELLKACASSDSHYSEAESAAELVAQFKAIGEKASAAMTRLTN